MYAEGVSYNVNSLVVIQEQRDYIILKVIKQAPCMQL